MPWECSKERSLTIEETACTATTFQAYINGTGPFIGWGEIGQNTVTVSDISQNKTEIKTNEQISK